MWRLLLVESMWREERPAELQQVNIVLDHMSSRRGEVLLIEHRNSLVFVVAHQEMRRRHFTKGSTIKEVEGNETSIESHPTRSQDLMAFRFVAHETTAFGQS